MAKMHQDINVDMKIVANELLDFADKNQKEVKENYRKKMDE